MVLFPMGFSTSQKQGRTRPSPGKKKGGAGDHTLRRPSVLNLRVWNRDHRSLPRRWAWRPLSRVNPEGDTPPHTAVLLPERFRTVCAFGVGQGRSLPQWFGLSCRLYLLNTPLPITAARPANHSTGALCRASSATSCPTNGAGNGY